MNIPNLTPVPLCAFSRIFSLLIFFAAAIFGQVALGQTTYLFDFNQISDGNGYPGGAGAWNQYAIPADVTGTIADTSGSTAAGISISATGFNDSGNTGWNNSSGGPSWATSETSLSNDGAVDDYFFSDNNSQSEFVITFSGLTTGETVSLDLFSPREGSGNAEGYYSYSLDGGSNWNGFTLLQKDGSPATNSRWNTNDTLDQFYRGIEDGNDDALYMNAGDVVLTGTTLLIRGQDSGVDVSRYATASAMRLTVIPEPSTITLVLGFAALMGVSNFRRRQHS